MWKKPKPSFGGTLSAVLSLQFLLLLILLLNFHHLITNQNLTKDHQLMKSCKNARNFWVLLFFTTIRSLLVSNIMYPFNLMVSFFIYSIKVLIFVWFFCVVTLFITFWSCPFDLNLSFLFILCWLMMLFSFCSWILLKERCNIYLMKMVGGIWMLLLG